jgi:glucose/mannose transport system permease protein
MTEISSSIPLADGPTGRKPQRFSPARIGVYAFLIMAAAFFLLPLYVMVMTSLKSMPEIRQGNIFALPQVWSIDAWIQAWSTACTGLNCGGIRVGFWNSVKILIPSMILSIFIASLTGYALSFWRVAGANVLFAVLLLGAFIPYQVFLYPLVRLYAGIGIYSTLPCIIITHTVFGLPVLTLLFRNYYASLPLELFKAARVDGAGLWQIFFLLMLPMSIPILVVAVILQVTGIWNDFLFGVVFSAGDAKPITVGLNNMANTSSSVKEYNVDMAAAMIAALPTLVIYVLAGKYFVRGLTAGAVKG